MKKTIHINKKKVDLLYSVNLLVIAEKKKLNEESLILLNDLLELRKKAKDKARIDTKINLVSTNIHINNIYFAALNNAEMELNINGNVVETPNIDEISTWCIDNKTEFTELVKIYVNMFQSDKDKKEESKQVKKKKKRNLFRRLKIF